MLDENVGARNNRHPYATIQRAQEAAPDTTEDVTVLLREGVYRITEPLEFDKRDSGRNGHPVHAVDGDSDTAWVTSHETMGIFNVEASGAYRNIRFKRPTSPAVSGVAELRVLAEE